MQKQKYVVELTISWEGGVAETYEHKSLKYTEIAAETEQKMSKMRAKSRGVHNVDSGCCH